MLRQVAPGHLSEARFIGLLQRAGLSPLGARQAIQGQMVADPGDRAALARILSDLAERPGHILINNTDMGDTY